MNSLVESIGDRLARVDVLASKPHVVSTLHNTVAACASLAKEVGQSKADGRPLSPQSRIQHESSSSRQQDNGVLLSPASPRRGLNMSLQLSPSSDTSLHPPPATASPVELSTFIRQLRLACAYNAVETLSDPTITLDSVRNKFRFLLSLMSREHLTSYYKASLQARLDPSILNPWQAVPFFGLGGAGPHYCPSSPPRGNSDTGNPIPHDWPLVSDPLLDFTAEIRESLDDTWFDARDLEGYLEEKEVCLIMYPPSIAQHEDLPNCIDVVRLLQGV